MRYKPGKQAVILDQVGNCAKHGMPDDEREWTLEDKPKRKKTELNLKEKSEFKTCPECGKDDIDILAKKCPVCGYLFGEDTVITDEKLVEIKAITKPKDCKTMAELYKLAELRGYKRGWAYYQAKQLDILKGKVTVTEQEIIDSVRKSNTNKKYPCKGLSWL